MALSERARLAAQAEETAQILRDQIYETDSGAVVDLTEALATLRGSTRTWTAPGLPELPRGDRTWPRILVTQDTSLDVAWSNLEANPLVLNFASATRPGGGWLSGSATQEESLCRASALYAALESWDVYERNVAKRDPLYVSAVHYAPRVPLIRNEYGRLVESPPSIAFVSCAAINFDALYRKGSLASAERTMRERIEAVVAVAILEKHSMLIAGAWGTGAFGGDPDQIAYLWRAVLRRPEGVPLQAVIFPIPDERIASVYARILLAP